MSSGTINVARSIWKHPVFRAGSYSEREAFLWLVSEASWKPRQKRLGNVIVNTERGQVCASLRFMGEAWGWQKDRVKRFLDRLENHDMVATATATGVFVITICNYDVYQGTQSDSATAVRQQPRQQCDSTATNENKDERKKETLSCSKPPEIQGSEFEEWYAVYPRKVAKGAARRAFVAARKKADLAALLHGARLYATKVLGKDRAFIAHPATWLNGERWLDADEKQTETPLASLERRVATAKDWLSRHDDVPTWMDNLEVAQALIEEGYEYEKLRVAGFSLPPRGKVVDISEIRSGRAGNDALR